MIFFWLLLVLVTSASTHTETIQLTASEFNATYSAANPLILSDLVIITLDEDILIATTDPLFILPVDLPFATLQFIEIAAEFAVQLMSESRFVIDNRSGGQILVEFKGVSQLRAAPGSSIQFNSMILRLTDASRFISIFEEE